MPEIPNTTMAAAIHRGINRVSVATNGASATASSTATSNGARMPAAAWKAASVRIVAMTCDAVIWVGTS